MQLALASIDVGLDRELRIEHQELLERSEDIRPTLRVLAEGLEDDRGEQREVEGVGTEVIPGLQAHALVDLADAPPLGDEGLVDDRASEAQQVAALTREEPVLYIRVTEKVPGRLERQQVPVERPDEGVRVLLEGLAEHPQQLEVPSAKVQVAEALFQVMQAGHGASVAPPGAPGKRGRLSRPFPAWHGGCKRIAGVAARESSRAGSRTRKGRVPLPTVADLMRREFITVAAAEPLLDAQRTMRLARLRHLLVVDDGALVGIVSYRDLQDKLLERAARGVACLEALRTIPVREAMVAGPYCVHPETLASEAARRMLRLRLGCLPVCEKGPDAALRLVGLLAESDLLGAAWK
ncbi:MAG: CBS domain-containing protein [Myxococcales bacterium]|nr:MAG: CBS domain-containing protein [Myxococcales bacterium]